MENETIEMVRKFKAKLKDNCTTFSQFAFDHKLWKFSPPSSLYAQLDERRSMAMHPGFKKAILKYLT